MHFQGWIYNAGDGTWNLCMLGKLSTSAATFPAIAWIFRQVHTLCLLGLLQALCARTTTPGLTNVFLNSSLLCSEHRGQREQDKPPC